MPLNDAIRGAGAGGVVRVLVAEDDAEMQQALCELIEDCAGLELIGLAEDADSAASMAASERPDVALLDVRMPGGGGLRAARLIRQRAPGTRLVAFSAYSDRATVSQMLRAGAVEYLVKGLHDDRIIDALRRTGRGVIGLPVAELEELAVELAQALERSEAAIERERADFVSFTGDLCARLGEAIARGEAAWSQARNGGAVAEVTSSMEACVRIVRDAIVDLAAVAVSALPDETGVAAPG